MTDFDDDIPYVPINITKYLEEAFGVDDILYRCSDKSGEYSVGYLKGVRAVLNHLEALVEEQELRGQ